jgi:hypothetical protein
VVVQRRGKKHIGECGALVLQQQQQQQQWRQQQQQQQTVTLSMSSYQLLEFQQNEYVQAFVYLVMYTRCCISLLISVFPVLRELLQAKGSYGSCRSCMPILGEQLS